MRRIFILAALLAVTMPAIAADDEKLVKTATLDITQTRVSFLVSGNAGGGVLHYQGKDYPFSVGGLGVGGIGISKLEAAGDVYNMTDRNKFTGVYSAFRTGYAAGDSGKGKLWLKNADGVVLELHGKSEGVALNLGADAVRIAYK
ncbi:MAG TPA: hypothetical protein VGM26_17900 [Rhizomicrobium sp.]|jgi:hypothetical protein